MLSAAHEVYRRMLCSALLRVRVHAISKREFTLRRTGGRTCGFTPKSVATCRIVFGACADLTNLVKSVISL